MMHLSEQRTSSEPALAFALLENRAQAAAAACYVLGFDVGCEGWLLDRAQDAPADAPCRAVRLGALSRRRIRYWMPFEEQPPRYRGGRRLAPEQRPLLPGYVFVWLTTGNLGFEDDRVFGLVRGASGGTGLPARVPDPLIDALRADADADGVFREHVRRAEAKPLRQGEQLCIARDGGDWAGFVGEFMRLEPRDRVRMLVGSIQVVIQKPRIERIGKVA